MKTKIAVLAAGLGIVTLAGLAYAATESTPAPATPAASASPGEGFQAHLAKKLGLSADQEKSIADLRAKERSEMQALHANTGLTPDARREQARAIAEKYRGQISAILTPEQQKKADEMRAHARKRFESFAERRGPRRPEGREGREGRPHRPEMRPEFDRNPMAIIAMAERIKDRMAAELKLTDDQRDKLDHLARAYREEQRAAAQKHREEMRAVLTPEQQQKFDKMQARMHRRDAGGPPPFAGMNGRHRGRMGEMGEAQPPPPAVE